MRAEEQCKRIRNKIRNYNKNELVQSVAFEIRKVENLSAEHWHKCNPYTLLTFFRWGLEYAGQNSQNKTFDSSSFRTIYNLISQAQIYTDVLRKDSSFALSKFLRIIAFQQFYLQRKLTQECFSRQLVLFSDIPEDHPIQLRFIELLGLTTKEFLEISFVIWSWFCNEKNFLFLKNEYFQSYSSKETLDKYLNLCSISLKNAEKHLENYRKNTIKDIVLHARESFPLTSYPFIYWNNAYLAYSQKIFEENIRNFIYDTVRSIKLSREFSKIFEIYIEKLINYSGLLFMNENKIQRKLEGNGKVTDFLIPLKDSCILLEAKSIVMKPLSKVLPENKQLINEFKTSIIKAVIQGYSIVNRIKKSEANFDIPNKSKFKLLIISYKDLNLGLGQDAWDEFIEEGVLKAFPCVGIDMEALSPEDIFIISIEELEQLMKLIKTKTIDLGSFLDKVTIENKSFETKRLYISQFLNQQQENEFQSIDFLKDRFELFLNQLLHEIS